MDKRELLIDFANRMTLEYGISWFNNAEYCVDEYLKSINQRFNETQAVRQNEDAENVCDVCGSKNTITVSHNGTNCDWCNPL